MTAGDWLVALLLSALIVVASVLAWRSQTGPAEKVIITAGGKTVSVLDIHRDQVVDVDGPLGTSRVEIRGGKVRISASPCSNHLCILRGWVQTTGDSVVCLPNRVAVTVVGGDPYYDAVTF